MINTEAFVKRLEIILEYYNHSSSTFADKIGVQRSSMSHLLSGRNKPSLDFVLKIIEEFPEVDLYWILFNQGTFPKSEIQKEIINSLEKVSPTPTLSFPEPKIEEKIDTSKNEIQEIIEPKIEPTMPILNSNVHNNDTEKIVIFYNNGTFKEYRPK